MAIERMEIDIFSNKDITVTEIQSNGMKTTHAISEVELTDRFGKRENLTTPILPSGCRFYARNTLKGYDIVLIEVPPRKVKMKFELESGETKNILVPLPFSNFIIAADQHRIRLTQVYLSKRPLVEISKHELLKFPFGNIDDSNNICWKKELRAGINLNEVNLLLEEFINMTFNGLLYNGKEVSEDFIEDISNQNIFPVNTLLKVSSLQEVLSEHFI